MERDGRHSSDSDTVAAPGPTSFLHPSNDARRHHRNPVKLEEQEKGIVNWGKPNRGLIIAATDLDSGDIPTACDTGRPKVTNSSVWAKYKQNEQ